MRAVKRPRWTTGDVRILKEQYPAKTIKEIMPLLRVKRSIEAVRCMTSRLNLTKRMKIKRWGPAEISFLVEKADTMKKKEIARQLNRSHTAILSMRHRIKNGKYRIQYSGEDSSYSMGKS